MKTLVKKAIGTYGNLSIKVSWSVWSLPLSLGFDQTFIGVRILCFGILYEKQQAKNRETLKKLVCLHPQTNR